MQPKDAPITRSNPAHPVGKIINGLDAAIIFCIGLFPAVNLKALQIIILLTLIGALLRGLSKAPQEVRLGWPHLALLQFALFFGLNALLFTPWNEGSESLLLIALEPWGLTILYVFVLWYYLGDGRDLGPHWRFWLPLGLLGSFAIMTSDFILDWGNSTGRTGALAPNSLTPPTWFLALTLVSFSQFASLSRAAKALRFLLFFLSAVMIVYAGARFAGLAWIISAIFLAGYLIWLSPPEKRRRQGAWLVLSLGAASVAAVVLDQLAGGIMAGRVRETLDGLGNPQSMTFYRLKLWSAALQVIPEHLPWGVGQINERAALSAKVADGHFFRAHQTYLSYLITGGLLALLSGLIFQAAPAFLLAKRLRRAMLPAAAGLIGVMALNGLTDSIFQIYVFVQAYFATTILLFSWGEVPSPQEKHEKRASGKAGI